MPPFWEVPYLHIYTINTRRHFIGNFAVWGGLFSAFDCSLKHTRQVEDVWNPIMAGAATGAVLAARGGWKASAASAVFGGVILAMIEGMGVMITRLTADANRPQLPQVTLHIFDSLVLSMCVLI